MRKHFMGLGLMSSGVLLRNERIGVGSGCRCRSARWRLLVLAGRRLVAAAQNADVAHGAHHGLGGRERRHDVGWCESHRESTVRLLLLRLLLGAALLQRHDGRRRLLICSRRRTGRGWWRRPAHRAAGCLWRLSRRLRTRRPTSTRISREQAHTPSRTGAATVKTYLL